MIDIAFYVRNSSGNTAKFRRKCVIVPRVGDFIRFDFDSEAVVTEVHFEYDSRDDSEGVYIQAEVPL